MKILHLGFITILTVLMVGCGNHQQQSPPITKQDTTEVNVSKPMPAKEVRIVFNIQAAYPDGALSPDAVYMGKQPVQDGSKIMTGQYTFSVQKKGYQEVNQIMTVDDPEGDNEFKLSLKLSPKERVALFDISDKETGQIISPDQVIIASRTESEGGKMVSHQSYVQPGTKRIVIQKKGYQSISEDIEIKPDEEPYVIKYQMTPQK